MRRAGPRREKLTETYTNPQTTGETEGQTSEGRGAGGSRKQKSKGGGREV